MVWFPTFQSRTVSRYETGSPSVPRACTNYADSSLPVFRPHRKSFKKALSLCPRGPGRIAPFNFSEYSVGRLFESRLMVGSPRDDVAGGALLCWASSVRSDGLQAARTIRYFQAHGCIRCREGDSRRCAHISSHLKGPVGSTRCDAVVDSTEPVRRCPSWSRKLPLCLLPSSTGLARSGFPKSFFSSVLSSMDTLWEKVLPTQGQVWRPLCRRPKMHWRRRHGAETMCSLKRFFRAAAAPPFLTIYGGVSWL